MLYLSCLLDSKITDSSDEVIGRLQDILIKPKEGEYVPLQYLVVKTNGSRELVYVPYEYVENLSREEVSLKRLFTKIPLRKDVESGFVYLKRDVLDQQIVDMSGARVVRVNDLRLGNFEGEMNVLGIDVSFKGLLRRLGLEWFDFLSLMKVNLIDWREAQPVHGSLKLDTVSKNLNKLHPADLANILEDLSVKHGSKLVKSLDAKSAASVLEEIDPHLQKILVKHLGPDKSADILQHMSVDEIVDLMKMMPKEEARMFLAQLKHTKLKKIQNLIIYPNDTAGGLMTVEFVSVRPNWKVSRAIKEVKKMSEGMRSIIYVYLTSEDGYFYGAVSMRWLILSPKKRLLKDLLKRRFSSTSVLHPEQDIEEVIEVMTKYNLYTAAVVDKGNKLIGVVSIDDVMRHLFPDA